MLGAEGIGVLWPVVFNMPSLGEAENMDQKEGLRMSSICKVSNSWLVYPKEIKLRGKPRVNNQEVWVSPSWVLPQSGYFNGRWHPPPRPTPTRIPLFRHLSPMTFFSRMILLVKTTVIDPQVQRNTLPHHLKISHICSTPFPAPKSSWRCHFAQQTLFELRHNATPHYWQPVLIRAFCGKALANWGSKINTLRFFEEQ